MGPGLLVRASAPGSLMVMGEHAVLYHHPALVTAINKRMTVTFVQREDRTVLISSHLGTLRTDLDSLEIQTPFQFVLAAIVLERENFSKGFELWIDSEFSHNVGFGSSAAVAVATLAVLDRAYNLEKENKKEKDTELLLNLLSKAHSVIKKVQGVGSGADAAASIFGGMISYCIKCPNEAGTQIDFQVEKLKHCPPLVAVYSGFKTPTPQVIKQVERAYHQEPRVFENLFKSIAACSESAKIAVQNADWCSLGSLMNIHQGLQSALGVSNKTLDSILEILRGSSQILGAKISGAGLGDCVIGLGEMDLETITELQTNTESGQHIPIRASVEGLRYEK